MKNLIKILNTIKNRIICYRLFQILPLNEKVIFFETFLGATIDANVSEILFELQNQFGSEYKYVWSVKDKKTIDFDNVLVVKRGSLMYYYYIARCKYLINNSRMPLSFIKRTGQIYVQTWHGTPLKKLVRDMETINMPNTNKEKYFSNFQIDVDKWDYLISPNNYSTEIFKRAFNYSGEILEEGYPRNKRLYGENNFKVISQIKAKLNLDDTKKYVLYTPTYRENTGVDSSGYSQDMMLDLDMLKNDLPNVVILVRVHYLIAKTIDFKKYDNVIDVSLYPDINDLYLVSDVLMTDYSSTMFDFSVLNKPQIFFAYDLEFYKNDLRGFYFDYIDQNLPGNIVFDTKSIINILKNLDCYIQDTKIQREEFKEKFIMKSEKYATINIINKIFKRR